MPIPLTLPQQLYLLSHHAGKDRLDDDSAAVRGSLLCGAAVAELRVAGLLRDRDGRAGRTDEAVPPVLDPFLAEVLDEVPADRPRRWFDVLEKRWERAEETVREQLAAARLITVEKRRALGVFPTERIHLTDPGPVQALRDRVRDAPTTIGEAVIALRRAS